jgi:hypothetical protein
MARHLSGASRTLHPLLAPAAILLGISALIPPLAPLTGPPRAAILADSALVERTVHEDAAAHRRTLVLLSMAEWIAAGHRDVPRDRFQSAIELSFGSLPQGDLLFSHIADGRYDTIVAPGRFLRSEPTPLGRFDMRIREAIEQRYAIAGPPQASTVDAYPGVIVFRKVR